MASLLDLNSASSDSEDDGDYVPPANVESDDSDDSCDEVTDDESPSPKKIKIDDKSEKDKSPESTDEKKSTDELWKNFLKGVETPGKLSDTKRENPKESVNDNEKTKNNDQGNKTASSGVETETNFGTSTITKDEKESKTNGDTSESSKAIATNCETNNNKLNDKPVGVKIGGGRTSIASVLGAISSKGKKMSVLEKSLQDWKKFKEQENIAEELQTFNKGKQGFIERQRFLQRSDLRLFESEKSARLGSKRK